MRKDFAKKKYSYKPPREYVRKDKLKGEIFKKRLKYTFLAFLLLANLFCASYWLFFSGFFDIKIIQIYNTNNSLAISNGSNSQDVSSHDNREDSLSITTKETIEKIIRESFKVKKWRLFSSQNVFLLDKNIIASKIKENIALVSLNIQKSYFKRALIINLQERKGIINLISRYIDKSQIEKSAQYQDIERNTEKNFDENNTTNNLTDTDIKTETESNNNFLDNHQLESYYLIDSEGYMTDVKNNKNEFLTNTLTIVYLNNREKQFQKMDKILDEFLISQIFFLNQRLSSQIYLNENGFNILSFTLKQKEINEIVIQTQGGPDLLISLKVNTAKQLNYLKLIMEKEIKDTLKFLKYIDLRVEDKIFYQ